MRKNRLLSGIRVLDLTDEKGFLCGKILADLGADVIKIEKPEGDPGRRIGPFYQDHQEAEKSLYWFAYNNNKRGITLDIETAQGREILKRLIQGSDMLIESFPPGYLDTLGAGYAVCHEINPRLIMVSITPFGQTGPYRDFEGSDLICMAMSGFMYICGDKDKPPVRALAHQAYFNGGAQGAVGAMLAYYHRESGNQGQHVDVSIQESLLPTMSPAVPYWALERLCVERYGSFRVIDRGIEARVVYPCEDGYVNFTIIGGMTGARSNRPLADWMKEEGMLPDFMEEMVWEEFDLQSIRAEDMRRIEESIGKFFLRHTKTELYNWAFRVGAMLYPVQDSKDLLESEQLAMRDFWETVEHPELKRSVTYPGEWVKTPGAYCGIENRAPLIGEHNREVYEGELGMSGEEVLILKQAGVI